MGALSQWPVSPEGKDRAPSSFVPGLSSLKEIAWTTILTQEPRLLHDSMTNLNRTVDRLSKVAAKARRPTRHLGRGPPRTKSRPTRAYPPPICLKPQIPATSRRLRLVRRFRQPPPPHLQNSNYLFLQRDLDRFLIRQKSTLGKLMLRNKFGLTERVPPAPISLQWLEPGFPDDPRPSLSAFERSLKLWRRELRGLKEADVVVAVELYVERKTAVERLLEGSDQPWPVFLW
jgi:hypothetical protein